MNILNLNDDALELVFYFLPLVTKFKMSRVYKRFRVVILNSCKRVKTIDCSQVSQLGCYARSKNHKIKRLDTSFIKNGMKYFPGLRSIDVTGCLSSDISPLIIITEQCQNILKASINSICPTEIEELQGKAVELEFLELNGLMFKKFPEQFSCNQKYMFLNNYLLNKIFCQWNFLKVLIIRMAVFRSNGPEFHINIPELHLETLIIERLQLANSYTGLRSSDVEIDKFFSIIIKKSKKLKHFEAIKSGLTITSVIDDLNTYSNLTNLSLSDRFSVSENIDFDEKLRLLFKKCNLIHLDLKYIYNMTGSCFNLLNTRIEEIILANIPSIKLEYLSECLPRYENLKTLDIKFVASIKNKKVPSINLSSIHLKKLSIFTNWGQSEVFYDLNKIIAHKNLEKLEIVDLSNDKLDIFLTPITNTMKNIMELSLFEYSSVTDTGLSVLSTLSNLKILSLNNLPNIDGSGLSFLKTLEILKIYNCRNIMVENLNSVILCSKNMKELKILNVMHSDTSTYANFINSAIYATKTRTNKLILKIICNFKYYKKWIDTDIIKGFSPFLQIKNYTDHYLCFSSSDEEDYNSGNSDEEYYEIYGSSGEDYSTESSSDEVEGISTDNEL